MQPRRSVRGARRIAGVDLHKERMRAVCAAVSALALDPRGFRLAELAARINAQQREEPREGRQNRGALRELDQLRRRPHSGAGGCRSLSARRSQSRAIVRPHKKHQQHQ